MQYFECTSCGYVYPPNHLADPGAPFKAMPDDWRCPTCQGPKTGFQQLGEEYRVARQEFEKKGQT